ncbi:phospholipase A2 inhibitor NAI-like [Zootoca vivipara]|uniref:phospholipase A2 inhibitor NAI-like n=1 Tax=Zootoca vivipara TaxID=8524 RepID=UPI00159055A5|nr:phospholipase A2 inhibitor NAI-like [Zootoca vivipara]
MQALLGFFLFSVLIQTGTSLECEVCSGLGSSCAGRMENCDAGQDTCVIAFTETSLGEATTQSVSKSCASSSVCNSPPTYMNFGQGKYIRSHITCCAGDACRTVSPQLSPALNKPNGKQCPGCYSFLPGGCETETVDCIGTEDYCLEMEEKVTYGKFTFHITMNGCASQPACAAKVGRSATAGVYSDITKAECTPAPISA